MENSTPNSKRKLSPAPDSPSKRPYSRIVCCEETIDELHEYLKNQLHKSGYSDIAYDHFKALGNDESVWIEREYLCAATLVECFDILSQKLCCVSCGAARCLRIDVPDQKKRKLHIYCDECEVLFPFSHIWINLRIPHIVKLLKPYEKPAPKKRSVDIPMVIENSSKIPANQRQPQPTEAMKNVPNREISGKRRANQPKLVEKDASLLGDRVIGFIVKQT